MKYKLEEYFCIYLDILGYSKRIENSRGDELKSQLNNFLNYVVSENKYLDDLGKIIEYKIRIFSDNILIALPATKDTVSDFHLVLSHIIDYQKTLIQSNYFIRGGISKGMLYIDDHTIWGPALIEAVKIEKSTVYPFISISKDIINLFSENNLLSEVNEYLSIPIIKIIEDRYFLDYLQTTIHFENSYPITYYTFIQVHKGLVEYNLKNNKDESIRNKYLLLAKYHNEFCNFYKEKLAPMQNYFIKDYFNTDVISTRKYLKFSMDDS